MDSRHLQQKYEATYKSFFEQHEIVISLPVGGMLHSVHKDSKIQSTIKLYYKTSLKIYIGARKSKSFSCTQTQYIDTHHGFVTSDHKFFFQENNPSILKDYSIGILIEYHNDQSEILINTGLSILAMLIQGTITLNHVVTHSIETANITVVKNMLGENISLGGIAASLKSQPLIFCEQTNTHTSFFDQSKSNTISKNIDHYIFSCPLSRPNTNMVSHNNSISEDKTETYLKQALRTCLHHTMKHLDTGDLTSLEIISLIRRLEGINNSLHNTYAYSNSKLMHLESRLQKEVGTHYCIIQDDNLLHIITQKGKFVEQQLIDWLRVGGVKQIQYFKSGGHSQGIGLCVDQRLQNDIYSPLSPKTITKQLGSNGIEIIDQDYNQSLLNSGLVLDGLNNKIYINGNSFTSKELPSQKATVEILGRLIANHESFISNKDIPASSYAKNKNLMVSKIIAPLNKQLKKNQYSPISIEIPGSLYEYNLCLKKSEIFITHIQHFY